MPCALARACPRWSTASPASAARSPAHSTGAATTSASSSIPGARRTWSRFPRSARGPSSICTTSKACCTNAAPRPKRGRRAAHRVFRRRFAELERTWLPRFSQVLATSETDAELVRAIAPKPRSRSTPTPCRATPLPPRGDEEAIVFSGNMEYHPNLSAVRFFRREIWPRLRERWPRLVWRLVGKNPGGRAAIYTRRSADRSGRRRWRTPCVNWPGRGSAVVPLLAGSGTRLKILEAWAAGLPVVSTTLGAEGLPARDGRASLTGRWRARRSPPR